MGYYAPSDGSDAGVWGSSLNASFTNYVDVNFAGITTLTLAGSNVTLSAAQARTQMLRLTGTVSADIVIDAGANLWNGLRCVENVTTGSHTVTLSNSGTCVIPQGRRCVVFLDSANGPRIVAIAGSSTADPIPSGTVMLFYQNAAPAGWTIVGTQNNKALRVVSSAGGVAGGTTAFTSVFTSRTPAGSVSTTTVDVPAAGYTGSSSTPSVGTITLSAAGATGPLTGQAWMSAARTLTTGAPTFTGTPMDFAVQYVDVILASRD